MSDTMIPADDFTELVDGDFPRVDVVGKSANGHKVLIAKSADDTDSTVNKEPNMPDTPAVEQVAKDAVAESASDGADVTEGGDTMQLAALADHDADSPDAEMDGVIKAGEAEALDGDEPAEVDLTDPLAEGTTDGVVGDELVPGSPAWESVDAATARKWTAVLYRAKNALEVLAEREGIEGASSGADGDEYENQWNLQDAGCAIDFAISSLATYAVSEENEAVVGTEALDAVGKAAAGIDLDQLVVLEEFAPVIKAGRVLSSANEGKIRDAVSSLQTVLDTLPAPVTDDVAKQTEPPAGPASLPNEVAKAIADAVFDAAALKTDAAPAADAVVEEPVVKADDALANTSESDLKRQALTGSGSEQKAALVELGLRVLMGTVGTDPDETPADPDDVGTTADEADAAAPAPAPEPASTDEPIAKSAVDVIKALITEQVAEVLTARDEEHALVVKALEDRITGLEAPAPSKVLTRGAERARGDDRPEPEPHVLRGQNVGALRHDTVVKEDWTSAVDAPTRASKALEMETAAAAALKQLHGTRPPHRS